MQPGPTSLVLLPLASGLLGFIEPCSIGSTLIVIKSLEGKSGATKVAQVSLFAVTRAIFMGLLGVLAVLIGSAFLNVQRDAWIALGTIYVLIGVLVIGRPRTLMASLGPSLALLSDRRGSAGLGLVFGLNIPACAMPLIRALLAAAAAHGATGGTLASGSVSLAIFGFSLSLPLVLAVLFEPARRALDWLAGLSRRMPFWPGVLLVVLGIWSIGLALVGAPKT